MDDLFCQLSADCPSLLFSGKLADIEALSRGDSDRLRPVIEPQLRQRLLARPNPGREVALVIGGNGFVGAHLVAALSVTPGVSRVYATVRGTAEQTPLQRFESTLAEYRITTIDRDRVTILHATPTQTWFGLTESGYQELAEQVDIAFNCASSTDYSASYLDLRSDWTLSLLRTLQFTIDRKPKHLTYLGSVGSYLYQSPPDFRRRDSWWYSGYCQMKWVNGALIRWLAREGVLSVTLSETPYVLGSTSVGIDPAQHYSWWRIIEIAKSIGCIWDGPGMNYIPVDVLVNAVVCNARAQARLDVMVPCNETPYETRLLAELLDLELVEYDEFERRAARQISARRMKTVLSSNFDRLVRLTNRSSILPEGVDSSWCQHERLFEKYLREIRFRDVRRIAERSPATAA